MMIDPADSTRRKKFEQDKHESELLLQPVFRSGKKVYESPSIQKIKSYASEQLSKLDKSVQRFENPHIYPVGLEESLHKLKTDLILKLRKV